MKTTNLKVRLNLVTPSVAKNYLRYNDKNRKVSEKNLYFLSNQMKNGSFLENGESIVFDTNGVLKDGQHRLEAIIKSGKSYWIPIVHGVEPLAMATYDTGKNRSASDILELSGFKSSGSISSLIIAINNYNNNTRARKMDNTQNGSMTNQQVLEYCEQNYDWINPLLLKAQSIIHAMKPTVMTRTKVGLFLYMIGGENPTEIHIEFMKRLTGVKRSSSTSTDYVFTKLYNAKINKEPLNFYWLTAMTIKAWNYFIDGNPAVKYFKFDTKNELPKIKEINPNLKEMFYDKELYK